MSQQQFLDLFDKSTKAQAWLELAIPTAIQIAKVQGYVTIDDVRKKVPIPDNIDKRVAGALFNDKKTFECIGYQKSTRTESHHRPIGKFRLVRKYKELA